MTIKQILNIQMTKQSTFKPSNEKQPIFIDPNDKQPTFKLFEYLYI